MRQDGAVSGTSPPPLDPPLVKGRTLIDTVGTIRERFGEAGLQRTIAPLGPDLRQLLGGSILASDWYKLDALTELVEASLRINEGGDEKLVIAHAEEVVARHLGGVYQLFVRLGSPEWIIKRIAAVHVTYFRNVDISPTFTGERRAAVRYAGFARQHRVMELMIVGFYRKALELSGARDRQVRVSTPIGAGKGYLEVELSW
jgi:hypothetical protein